MGPHANPPQWGEIPRGAATLFAVLLLLAGCTLQPDVSQAAPNGRIGTAAPALSGQTLAGDQLSVDFRQSKTVLIFWAAWCGPCRALAPAVDAIADMYKGRVKVGKLDVDANGSTSARFNVRGIPTLLLFKGGQVREQLVGLVDKSKISDAINKHLG